MSKKEHDKFVAQLRTSEYDRARFKSAAEILRKHKLFGMKGLDLGCGNCEFSEIMRNNFQMHVTCSDYIPSYIERAKFLGFDTIFLNLDSDGDEVDVFANRYKNNFDFVVCLATIEHIFDLDNILRFCHNILKPNGKCIINTPNISFLGFRFYSLLSGNRPFGDGHHVRFFDYRILRTHLYLNGFKIIGDYRKFYKAPSYILIRCLRGNKVLSKAITMLFLLCHILQHIPFLRSICTDELTVLAEKEDIPPIGFEILRVKKSLEEYKDRIERKWILERLKSCRNKGWLNEHLNLKSLIDSL